MAKSWDSSTSDTTLLSLYKEQGHRRVLNTPTKIYAPDGVISSAEGVTEANADSSLPVHTSHKAIYEEEPSTVAASTDQITTTDDN